MKTLLITGGTGYIGKQTVLEGLKLGYDVYVLTRKKENAKELEQAGATIICGDIYEIEKWKHQLNNMQYIVHLASPPTWGKKVTKKVASEFADGHYRMTTQLLDTLLEQKGTSALEKIVYIAGTSYFGDTGDAEAKNEMMRPDPKGWGPYIRQSVQCLPSYIKKGLPITVAFPAQVYGPDSWMPQLFLEPLSKGKAVVALKGYNPYFAPIHVEDCARACLHLLDQGKNAEWYLLCDDEPLRSKDFMNAIANVMKVEGKTQYVPAWLARLIIGPVLTEYSTAHSYFLNTKLKQTGFSFRYPTCRHGLPSVVQQWQKKNDVATVR